MGTVSEATVAERISERTKGEQKYISGYSSPVKYATIRVRCSTCGGEWENSYHSLTAQYRGCPICREQIKKAREEKTALFAGVRKKIKEQNKLLRERWEADAERQRTIRNAPKPCPVCGKLTTRPKYCSALCYEKASNSAKEARRREKIKGAMVDKDITVMGLFKRDAGICYLCGERCNAEDFTIRDGNFIAGDWYPSVDHVVPLSKGGEHSWSNVKLAHRRCNSRKSDKFVEI